MRGSSCIWWGPRALSATNKNVTRQKYFLIFFLYRHHRGNIAPSPSLSSTKMTQIEGKPTEMREPKQNKQNSRLRKKWFTTRALKDGNRISSIEQKKNCLNRRHCVQTRVCLSQVEKKKTMIIIPSFKKIKSTSYRASMLLLLWLLFSWFKMGKKCSARPHVKHFSRSSHSTRLPILKYSIMISF